MREAVEELRILAHHVHQKVIETEGASQTQHQTAVVMVEEQEELGTVAPAGAGEAGQQDLLLADPHGGGRFHLGPRQ